MSDYPDIIGDQRGARTHDPEIKSPTLIIYPRFMYSRFFIMLLNENLFTFIAEDGINRNRYDKVNK